MSIEKYLTEWLTKSDQSLAQKMIDAYQQKGGWEVWAQVEFGRFLTNKNYYKSVEREVAVFKSASDRADLLCSGDTAAQSYLYDIVELKTETIFQSGSGKDNFKKRVEGDVAKLGKLASSYNSKNTRVTAVGISIAAQTTKDVKIAWDKKMNTIDVYAKDAWWIAAFYITSKPG
jgi:hypothetical protein